MEHKKREPINGSLVANRIKYTLIWLKSQAHPLLCSVGEFTGILGTGWGQSRFPATNLRAQKVAGSPGNARSQGNHHPLIDASGHDHKAFT